MRHPAFSAAGLPAGTRFSQPIPPGHNAFTYTYRGTVRVEGTEVPDRNMAILSNDGALQVTVRATGEARLLIVAGQPLNEPIAQHGPFVMNTGEEIQQAMRDYRDGLFESASVQSL